MNLQRKKEEQERSKNQGGESKNERSTLKGKNDVRPSPKLSVAGTPKMRGEKNSWLYVGTSG